ncbi:hypothetical protein OG738_29880 [Amycolatopsis sp. NBC_01488]|uniref:hypothetical protein n=1 Tax=Amycolatopsis sp. NBC_01488 TaxID=2903563 RepID=UPI002E2D2F41|nr:hypothetical protein [Amycolatopsis sp. NBC_01488]
MSENPVILVTGTSEGLGYGTARLLAAGTTTVIAHARTAEGSQAACERHRRPGLRPVISEPRPDELTGDRPVR